MNSVVMDNCRHVKRSIITKCYSMKNPEKRKPGRPSIGLGNIVQIRLDDATAEAVEDYANRTVQDRSAALRELIRAALASDTGRPE